VAIRVSDRYQPVKPNGWKLYWKRDGTQVWSTYNPFLVPVTYRYEWLADLRAVFSV
jgi:hypothetical protein